MSSFVKSSNVDLAEEVEESLAVQNYKHYQISISQCFSLSTSPKFKVSEYRCYEADGNHTDGNIEELTHPVDELMSKNVVKPSVSSNSLDQDMNLIEHQSSFSEPDIPFDGAVDRDNEESDPLYKKYKERMRWFDMLNHERTCGLNVIMNEEVGVTTTDISNDTVDYSNPFSSFNKESRRRLLKSIESDIELVYVAQSCLSWDALQHQYRNVKALACSSSPQGIFYNSNVAGEFQKFQILLERFVENERCGGKRIWNFIKERFSSKNFLQVPQVSGFMNLPVEEIEGEVTSAKEMLKAIDQCIEVFWVYVKTDYQNSWWKSRWFLSTYTQVEDPRDLTKFADLNKKLQKKELLLKDLRGKKKCWLKKIMGPLSENQGKEILFAMIDMKLVSRVLRMKVISTSQLKWCHEKLDNIMILEGELKRVDTGTLFPPS